jgi:hypothetical protein
VSEERYVTLVCTDQGKHPKRRLDRVTLREGEAVSLEECGPRRIRRAYAEKAAGRPVSDFDEFCSQCGRGPQAGRGRMTVIVTHWLAESPDHRSVVRDISDPAIARWF